jgi:hypothetical protein
MKAAGFVLFGFMFFTFACSKTTLREAEIVGKTSALPEFKRAAARIDSLNQAGIKTQIQVSIVKDSFYPEDSLKNLSLAFIEENDGIAQTMLYEIKFDKTTSEFVLIRPAQVQY